MPTHSVGTSEYYILGRHYYLVRPVPSQGAPDPPWPAALRLPHPVRPPKAAADASDESGPFRSSITERLRGEGQRALTWFHEPSGRSTSGRSVSGITGGAAHIPGLPPSPGNRG